MNIFNLYSQSMELTENLGNKALEVFKELSLEEKLLLALTEDVEFLGHEPHYTPSDPSVSLHSHLFMDRGASQTLDDLVENALEDFTDEGVEKEVTYLLNTQTPVCCVIRDMLENNLGSFTYDW